jgi:hypothetical protein
MSILSRLHVHLIDFEDIVEVISYRFKLTQSHVTYKYMYIVVATFLMYIATGFYPLLIVVSAHSTDIHYHMELGINI